VHARRLAVQYGFRMLSIASIPTLLLLNGVDLRQIQELLGYSKVETTMIYTHVVKDMRNPVASPFDLL
jgi:site-specific recombinase XerC